MCMNFKNYSLHLTIPGQNQVSSSTLNTQQQPGGSGTPIHVAPPGHNSQQFYNATQTAGVPDRPAQDTLSQNIGEYLWLTIKVIP